MIDFAEQAKLGSLLLTSLTLGGHILLGSEIVKKASVVIMHRTDEQVVPEARTILAVVEELYLNIVLLGDSTTKLGNDLRRSFRSLKEAAIATEHFFFGVTGHLQEGVVREHDGIVGLSWIAHHHRHPRTLDRDEREFTAIDQTLGGGGSG
ncbi:MAG: hypothetical protein AVDCRST_MAG62-862 [uncultured Sphingomonas sp.]|uniref:Uncharacterized protein n=1 Tax=uncultured Sphingomonas sp. TaxID=158754 RepID=A0A6J4T8R6_9SPHN|nr:MAG: hypothetical protein AVDCRST_MAG62-862 [uncultured Sphingomonas sp.]